MLNLRKRKKGGTTVINRNEFKASYDRLGLNQNDVASMIGVNPTTLQRKLNGTSDFNRNEIQLLKSGLKLSVDQVVNIFFADDLHIRKN